MAVYTVYVPDFRVRTPGLPPHSGAATEAALPEALFVREGFSRAAFFLGPFWLAWHRLWGFMPAWLAIASFLAVEGPRFLGVGAIVLIALLLEILLGLEGNRLRGAELGRRGFRLSDVAAGPRRDDAERSFYHRALSAAPASASAPPHIAGTPRTTLPDTNEVVGLFPQPEDRR